MYFFPVYDIIIPSTGDYQMTTIIAEASKILKEVTPIIEHHYGIKMPAIDVKASGKMLRVFGRAKWDGMRYTVTISKYAYEGKTDTNAFRNTVVHEIAHVVEHIVFRRFSHSPDWSKVMKICNEVSARFVTKEKRDELNFVRAPKRKITKYVHTCAGGCKHTVGGQIHNKILKGHYYSCKRTGGKLSMSFETVKG